MSTNTFLLYVSEFNTRFHFHYNNGVMRMKQHNLVLDCSLISDTLFIAVCLQLFNLLRSNGPLWNFIQANTR